ncbi:hypothetical protein HS041_22380 [Planomonospora sp. ID67723]|uniref:phage tail tube protein n=1 Tax=Planomonospora sp. ID67723 TaxID=2738134 RepID=UPI0018C397DA|nr:hypothetical protein [Planomonospora sp. ID67723]MBG0830512.1 hypothetical protein [Planomonospora sp. ID67723]
MTQRKINARDMIVEILDDDDTTYLTIENLAAVKPNKGENEEVADTTDYDSEGVHEHEVMQRGATMEIEGHEKKDHLTGALQPGRARVEEMAGESKVGADSLATIRFRHVMDTTWKIWRCTVTLGESGGGHNDKSAWAATFTKSGPTTTAAVS